MFGRNGQRFIAWNETAFNDKKYCINQVSSFVRIFEQLEFFMIYSQIIININKRAWGPRPINPWLPTATKCSSIWILNPHVSCNSFFRFSKAFASFEWFSLCILDLADLPDTLFSSIRPVKTTAESTLGFTFTGEFYYHVFNQGNTLSQEESMKLGQTVCSQTSLWSLLWHQDLEHGRLKNKGRERGERYTEIWIEDAIYIYNFIVSVCKQKVFVPL